MDMGCVVYDVVYVIKSVWLTEDALHFVIRRGVWGWQGGGGNGFDLFGLFCFACQLSHVLYGDDDNTPTPLW